MTRRRGYLACLLSMALALVAAAPSYALNNDEGDIVVSPDGAHVYVTTSTGMLALSRDAADGGLTLVDRYQAGAGERLAMSPDGRSLYVTVGLDIPGGTRQAVSAFTRDPVTGALTPAEVGTRPGYRDLAGDVIVAPDGLHAFAATGNNADGSWHHGVLTYTRDPATGSLSPGTFTEDTDGPFVHFGYLAPLALTGDGLQLYAGSELFEVSPDGALTPRPEFECGICESAWVLAVNPAGDRLHVGHDRQISVLPRDPADGTLADSLGAAGPFGPRRALALASDGSGYFAGGADGLYRYAPGPSEFGEVTSYGGAAVPGLVGAHSVALSPDGLNLYVASPDARGPGSVTSASVAVFTRSPADGSLTFASLFEDPLHPAVIRVAINDGDRYTNDPEVVVTVAGPPWPGYTFSNDAAFMDPMPFQWRPDQRYPWRLAAAGPESGVRTVYVAGGPDGLAQDDIVLDRRAPVILAASLSRRRRASRQGASRRSRGRIAARPRERGRVKRRLVLRARDNRSRVRQVQIRRRGARPGRRVRYRRRIAVRGAARGMWVRVFDGAGNHSRWRRVRVPRR